MNQHEIEQRRELLIKKICMAQVMAAQNDENQAIFPNAIGGLDIVPCNRDQSDRRSIVIIGIAHSNRISNGQASLLIRMTDSGYTKEDVVHAAYAMGYLAAEAKLKRAIDRMEKLAKDLMIDVTVLDDVEAPPGAPVDSPPVSILQRDGMPTFYISKEGYTSTHRMSDDDVPVWVKGFDNAMAAMSRIEANQQRRSSRDTVPPLWRDTVRWFVERCESGEVRSKVSYSRFKALLTGMPAEAVSDEPPRLFVDLRDVAAPGTSGGHEHVE